MKWEEQAFVAEVASRLEKKLNVSTLIAKLLSSRNISSIDEADRFLSPKLAHLQDPFNIPNMEEAVERIIGAIVKNEEILLVGDYDVDGISSVSIIQKTITLFEGKSSYVIPKRKDEGYGLSEKVLTRGLLGKKASLVIALDCGTNSLEEADFLKSKGIDLIIVDHHQAKGEISKIPIILNPHLHHEEGSPWFHLCTAGLAFKLTHALIKSLRNQGNQTAKNVSMKDYLPLSALGTIADLVPLQKENRIIAKFGLKHLKHSPSPGIKALLHAGKIDQSRYPGSEDVTFKLAPMINACGRMDDPTVATSLFLENEDIKCDKLALQMDAYNEQRKVIESQLTEEAKKQATDSFSDKPAVVVDGDTESWNPGVVGIVAGKLANSLNKPCLVLAKSDNEEYRGSGRGIKGLDLVKALAECQNLLTHWGGHPVAVGLSIKEKDLSAFKKKFVDVVSQLMGDSLAEPSIKIDSFIERQELNDQLLEELEMLAPYGQGNPEPILGIKNVRLAGKPRKVGSGDHFQFAIHNGNYPVSGIAWRMADSIPNEEESIDIAFRLQWNVWNQRKRLQMVMVDWKSHQ
ncbi:single-stranded-DNA-specific exonuclease RecJ [Opitutales bacterium]|nr:single-stranded-DNA-specific exonuclease RecJ [Opitutales bacterium]